MRKGAMYMMSDIPRCPRGPGRPPRGSVPFVPVPWPRPRPPSRLPVLSVNGLAPDRDGDVSLAYVDSASYEPEYGDPPAPAILLKHGETVVAAVDASAFVIDGMVDDVEVTGGNLVITFNTAAGKRPISIPLTLFFDPLNYYTKTDVNGLLAGKADRVSPATDGDIAALDANGNLKLSGMNRDGNGNLDATSFPFLPSQVADYDALSAGDVVNKNTTPVVLHSGEHWLARKSFAKTGVWNDDVSAGRLIKPGAAGVGSTAWGEATFASGNGADSEGKNTKAFGAGAHSEGQDTDALSTCAHAEGLSTVASGSCSHSEGMNTVAAGHYSHAEGSGTWTRNAVEHAQGQYNASHKASGTFGNAGNTLASVGCGADDAHRANAVEVMQDGKVFIKGVGKYDGTNSTGLGHADDLAHVLASSVATKSGVKLYPVASGSPQFSEWSLGVTGLPDYMSVVSGPTFSSTLDPVWEIEINNGAYYDYLVLTGPEYTADDTLLRFSGQVHGTRSDGVYDVTVVASRSCTNLSAWRLGPNDGPNVDKPLQPAGDYVPSSRTVNGQPLASDVALTAGDVKMQATGNTTVELAVGSRLDVSFVADKFKTNQAYTSGQKVVYDSKVYEFTQDKVAGNWNSNVVRLLTIDDLLADKANRASNPTAGNLAALDANGNPTDSTIAAANVALKSAIPYDLRIAILALSSEVVGGETVYYGEATLTNRTANIIEVTAATPLDELRITFPAATRGKVRDFGLRVEIGTGSAALAAPALVPIAPTGETIKIENADGTIPELADGTATAKGVTLLYFSETAPGVFVVKGEQVEEVA